MAESTALALPSTFTKDEIDLIKNTIAKGATDHELALFLKQCDRTQLDPFARQIYSVRRKQYNSQSKQYEEAQVIQVSIDGFRLIADRTGKYAGQVGPWWCGKDGEWREVWLEDVPPAAAKVGVLRHDFHQPLFSIAPYKGYVQTNSNGDPISRWKTDPAGMLAKCAEALALRRAFPNDLSGLYATEEMGQADNDTINGSFVETHAGGDNKSLPETTNGNGKTSAEPVTGPVDPVEHLTFLTNLPAARVKATLKYCGLMTTATLKDYEVWWLAYKSAREDNLTPAESGHYATLVVMNPSVAESYRTGITDPDENEDTAAEEARAEAALDGLSDN